MTDLAGMGSLLPLGLIVGVLIGCIGIGGVLLVPSLTYIGGMPVHLAVAACMFSYLFSGAVGAVAFARRGSIRWSMGGWLCAGAMPGAFLGAANVSVIPGVYLELFIAALILFSGLHALLRRVDSDETRVPGITALIVIGTITGYGSALSGTGGPLLLVPILVYLRVPMLTAVGLGQVIQLPIAALATWGNWVYGIVDFKVGLGIAVLLMIGVAAGAHIAHWVPARTLRRIVALVLLAVSALILVRLSIAF